MRIIEIAPLDNGAHRNQSYPGFVPDGWAVVPDSLETENFPFGEVEVEEVIHYKVIQTMKDVVKTREVETVDENGNPITITEEYTVQEMVTEQEPYGIMTVTEWIPGEFPVEPEIILTPSQLREQAYNNDKVIEWEDQMITITEASQLWQYYAAEGSLKATILQELIADAKMDIRLKYPD